MTVNMNKYPRPLTITANNSVQLAGTDVKYRPNTEYQGKHRMHLKQLREELAKLSAMDFHQTLLGVFQDREAGECKGSYDIVTSTRTDEMVEHSPAHQHFVPMTLTFSLRMNLA
jgi:hypothetical protein